MPSLVCLCKVLIVCAVLTIIHQLYRKVRLLLQGVIRKQVELMVPLHYDSSPLCACVFSHMYLMQVEIAAHFLR